MPKIAKKDFDKNVSRIFYIKNLKKSYKKFQN